MSAAVTYNTLHIIHYSHYSLSTTKTTICWPSNESGCHEEGKIRKHTNFMSVIICESNLTHLTPNILPSDHFRGYRKKTEPYSKTARRCVRACVLSVLFLLCNNCNNSKLTPTPQLTPFVTNMRFRHHVGHYLVAPFPQALILICM